MAADTIILTAFSVLFAIIGFLIVNKLNTIDKTLERLTDKLDDQKAELSEHSARLQVIESKLRLDT